MFGLDGSGFGDLTVSTESSVVCENWMPDVYFFPFLCGEFDRLTGPLYLFTRSGF